MSTIAKVNSKAAKWSMKMYVKTMSRLELLKNDQRGLSAVEIVVGAFIAVVLLGGLYLLFKDSIDQVGKKLMDKVNSIT